MQSFMIGLQIVLFVGGVSTTFLLNRNDKWNKWGSVLGLIVQPFFILSGWLTAQWGIVGAAAVNALFFAYGIYIDFFTKK